MEGDTLNEVTQLWDSASIYAEQQQHQWAINESLANGRHITARKPGRSSIFVPKIPAYIRRKMADIVAQFDGAEPISIKNTITSHPVGAKIKQKVQNYYIKQVLDYTSIIYNVAYSAYTYNYAPLFLDWVETYDEQQIEQSVQMPDGSIETSKVKSRELVESYPTVECIPPEDFRIDPSATWDALDDARYIGFRTYRSKEYVDAKIKAKEWPKKASNDYEADNSTTGNTVKFERTSQASPFQSAETLDGDNNMVEIRYHFYFEEDGKDWIPVRTVTLGDSITLEDAKELTVDWGGQGGHAWPFVVGQVYPKPFEQYASALPELARDLQIEINAIRNQRRDNVSLILNPEKYVTPHAGVTPSQLAYSYPGKIVSVDNLNGIQWQTVPDVTSTGHNEESRAEGDLDRLLSEGPLRQGVEGKRKESATAMQMMGNNASASTGLDATMLMESCIKPLNIKLGNAIAQKAHEDLFQAAAADIGVKENFDPYISAVEGDFVYNVFATSSQNELANALANSSNLMGVIQTTYGAQANYKPLIDKVLEIAGYDPDSIIPNPLAMQMNNPAQVDAGGVDPQGTPSIQPRAQFQGGGAMGAGSGNQ